MLAITVPGAVAVVFGITISVAMFDLCEGHSKCFGEAMGAVEDNEFIPSGISDLGIQNTNTFLILGSNSYVLLLPVALMILRLFCIPCCK